MLYLFTWNSDFLVKNQMSSWKTMFIEKHGDFNISHFKNLSEIDKNTITSTLTSTAFMWGKKLVIIDDLPGKPKDKKEIEEFLEEMIDLIPEENIVLFNSVNPDKRSKLYKKIKKIWEIKEFPIKDENDVLNLVKSKYKNISPQAIKLITKYKAQNLDKIFMELEKLSINYDFIDVTQIEENIIPELEESIFQFIDDLLNLRLTEALKKMKIILEQTNIYAFYNNLIANLRVQVYIELLKTSPQPSPQGEGVATRLNPNKISEILWLWNRSFLVNKNYRIWFEKLEVFYINLVNLDKKMKTWSMIWSEEEVFTSEIERCILKIK